MTSQALTFLYKQPNPCENNFKLFLTVKSKNYNFLFTFLMIYSIISRFKEKSSPK